MRREFSTKSKTQKQFRFRNDPVSVYQRATGKRPQVAHENNIRQGFFGDFLTREDFHQQQMRVKQAMDRFNQLPAELKTALSYDPANMIQLVNQMAEGDQESIDFAVEHRLLPRKYHSDELNNKKQKEKRSSELRDKIIKAVEKTIGEIPENEPEDDQNYHGE